MLRIFLCSCLVLGASASAEESSQYGRYADKTEQWERVDGELITGFYNMYNLHIVHEPNDADYPFKGWFFGWATGMCNPGYPGCDAIFAARAPALAGPWEVYCGDKDGKTVWDASMTASKWVPVISGGDTIFDSWHNGDPSVVRRNGVYHMIYSATGRNADGVSYGQEGDTDSDISCVMAAVSEDGLHWSKSDEPVLVHEPNIGQPPMNPGGYMHPEGLFHRPSLMREDGMWKAWFDCFDGQQFTMLCAENRGDFMDPDDWTVVRGMDKPCIFNYPNPDVVKIHDLYIAFADPGGHPEEGWASRKTTWAVSLNGLDWAMAGYMEPDADVQANQVPEALVMNEGGDTYVYVNYGAQIPGDYRYDKIRMRRWKVTADDLERLRVLATNAEGPVPFTPKR